MALPVALQLYSVREDFAADLQGTCKAIKEMGYDGVELAGFGPHGPAAVKAALDAHGLQCVSAHVPYDDMLQDAARTFATYKDMGCDYVSLPWLDMETAPGGSLFSRTLPVIEGFGKTAKEHGLTLLYHNHDFEFRKIGDKYALDVLFEEIPADILQTQIDICWVKYVGLDPAAYLRKYSGRAPLVHLKDYAVGGPDGAPFTFKPLGGGVQDIPLVLKAVEDIGARWIIVEYDRSPEHPPLETARISREYLQSLGW